MLDKEKILLSIAKPCDEEVRFNKEIFNNYNGYSNTKLINVIGCKNTILLAKAEINKKNLSAILLKDYIYNYEKKRNIKDVDESINLIKGMINNNTSVSTINLEIEYLIEEISKKEDYKLMLAVNYLDDKHNINDRINSNNMDELVDNAFIGLRLNEIIGEKTFDKPKTRLLTTLSNR